MTELSKDDAREETLRRWRGLPAEDRQTTEQAQFFAAALAGELDFRTIANKRKLIESWLTNEMAGLPPWGNVPPEVEVRRQQVEDMKLAAE